MRQQSVHEAIRVAVSRDRMTAEVVIPSHHDGSASVEALELLLTNTGVAATESVRAAVLALANAAWPAGRHVVARGCPPTHGTDGSIQWHDVPERSDADGKGMIDFYAQAGYRTFAAGEAVATLTEPTAGVDGLDVCGRVVAAKAGKPCHVSHDDTIDARPDGRWIAQLGGILNRTSAVAHIDPVFSVDGSVDFSTGHVRFDGDVLVGEGVRSRFRVEATGNIHLRGLIEDAIIQAGRDLHIYNGMAGGEFGHIEVGGDMTAHYLDNVRGTVEGNLNVSRELMNCHLAVGGGIVAPAGAIVGGTISVASDVEVAALGSDATPTILRLASMPQLEAVCEKFSRVRRKLIARRKTIESELDAIGRHSANLPEAMKQHRFELRTELVQIEAWMAKADAGIAQAKQTMERRTRVNLRVHRGIASRVTLRIGGVNFDLTARLRGPLHIGLNPRGIPTITTTGGRPRPLADMAAPLPGTTAA